MSLIQAVETLPEAAATAAGGEVYRGLTARRKFLSPWLFYDQAGSALFEKITALPEYYPTRTERDILAAHAQEVIDEVIEAASCGPGPAPAHIPATLSMIELGAGTARKTGLLLGAAVRRQGRVSYTPIDVSESALEEARRNIEQQLPGVEVCPVVADYTAGMDSIPGDARRRLVLYIGSSIGNFEPGDALELLRGLRARLRRGECLLLGVDMVKDPALLRAAYNDASGVTAAFNKNVLVRINREFGANFDLKRFRHKAVWNAAEARIEMHLESTLAQRVSIPDLDLDIAFRRGETIHTENSYKFTPARVESLLERAGFAPAKSWSDARGWFGVYLASAR